MAKAFGKDPVELIIGYATPLLHSSTVRWFKDVFGGWSAFRSLVILSGIQRLRDYIHRGDVVPGGEHRALLRSQPGAIGFGAFPIDVSGAKLPVMLTLSYRQPLGGEHSSVVIDYGHIKIGTEEARGRELWTLRTSTSSSTGSGGVVWIRTWLDGDALTSYLRSEKPFKADTSLLKICEPPPGACVITFHPTAFHRHAG